MTTITRSGLPFAVQGSPDCGGKLRLINGQDAWVSTDGGAFLEFNGKLWLTGDSDLWSTSDGTQWTRRTANHGLFTDGPLVTFKGDFIILHDQKVVLIPKP